MTTAITLRLESVDGDLEHWCGGADVRSPQWERRYDPECADMSGVQLVRAGLRRIPREITCALLGHSVSAFAFRFGDNDLPPTGLAQCERCGIEWDAPVVAAPLSDEPGQGTQ